MNKEVYYEKYHKSIDESIEMFKGFVKEIKEQIDKIPQPDKKPTNYEHAYLSGKIDGLNLMIDSFERSRKIWLGDLDD